MFIILSNFSFFYKIMVHLPLKQQQQQNQQQQQQEKEDEWVWFGSIQTSAVGFQSVLHLVMCLTPVYVFSYLKSIFLLAAFTLPAFLWPRNKKGSHNRAWKQYFSGLTRTWVSPVNCETESFLAHYRTVWRQLWVPRILWPRLQDRRCYFYPVRLFKGKTCLLLNKQ